MEITYDHAKHDKNIRERGLDFQSAEESRFDTAEIRSVWKDKGRRFVATGFLNERLHVYIFIDTDSGFRVISFRKVNKREARDYEESRRNLEQGPDLIDDDGEVRELTKEDFKSFRPFSELPKEIQEKLLAINRGPNTFSATDEEISVPISRSVDERFQSSAPAGKTA